MPKYINIIILSIIAFLLNSPLAYCQKKLKNLSSLPCAKYTYLDDNGNVLGNKKNNDKTGLYLSDNSCKTVIVSKYGANLKKKITVLYEFPIQITPEKLRLIWMWGHNPKQWFDQVKVFSGNSPEKMKQIAVFSNKRIKQNTVHLLINLKKNNCRFVKVIIEQKPDVKHLMMGFGELTILGSKDDYLRLKNTGKGTKKVSINIGKHYPCNIFGLKDTVVIPVEVDKRGCKKAKLSAKLIDYFDNIVDEKTIILKKHPFNYDFQFKSLAPGYYKLKIFAELQNRRKESFKAEKAINFGVCKKFNRSASEALAAGCRFGIQLGFFSEEGGDAFEALGLQWFRALLQYGPIAYRNKKKPYLNAKKLIDQWLIKRQFNSIFELKTFPSSCYDAKRYGARKSPHWFINSVPKEKEYTKFTQDIINLVPRKQKIFEIWNEPWDKMPAKEFAEVCQMTLKAIKSIHPDAVVGPNLGPMAHLVQVIKAGGLKGMDMLSIHPYSPDFTSSPEKIELRNLLRAYKNTLRKYLGKELPLYVTEIGWPTPPKGPMSNSEKVQAQYMVRACLIMLAEDIKAVTPYCLGQSESNPAEKEHFFGFIRKNKQPKPVLIAYANMNRIMEGSKYLGDLWLGVDIGAMLFEKNGKNILILHTDGESKKVFLRPYCQNLKIVNIVGAEKDVEIVENRLSLTLTGDPLYLVGVGDELKSKVVASPKKVWSKTYKRNTRKAKYISPDSNLNVKNDWGKLPEIKVCQKNVPENDASAIAKIGWNKENLYLDIQITDNDPGHNNSSGSAIWHGDSIELFISSSPDTAVPGFLKKNDYQILVSPYSKSGKSVIVFGDVYRRGKKLQDVKYSFSKQRNGWNAKLIIPFKNFKGFTPVKGARMALEIALNDKDKAHPRIQLTSNKRNDNWSNSSVWSFLELEK